MSEILPDAPRPFLLRLARNERVKLPAALHPDGVDGMIGVQEWAARMLDEGASGITFEGPTP